MTERIGLVGCVKTKLDHAAPAKDLYTSPLFRGRRAFVERSCGRWFILSAKHGLVDPDEVLEPYDLTLGNSPAAQRRAWSKRALLALGERLGSIGGLTFEAHAGSSYLDYGLADGLRASGARVERPAEGLGLFEQQAFYASGKRSPRIDRSQVARGHRAQSGKYSPLAELLDRQTESPLVLGFDELETFVGALPASARNHRAWWANDQSHAQARAWLGAGWRVASVDPHKAQVRFARR